MKGIVFDIQRYSVNDGPGIRTTVFLKGCCLNCSWCHNEESISTTPMLRFFADKCQNCMECVKACKVAAHLDVNGLHKVEFSSCIQNWDCIEVCPSAALIKTGESVSADSVLETVMKDDVFYRNSGGGITISGGEPMVQFEFTRELLQLAQSKGLHTCLDTTGHASWDRYSEIMKHTDLFLFDFKETDPDQHQEHTGVSNDLVLESLEKLNQAGASIILRCPIIPGVNDRTGHFRTIAELSRKYANIREVHILPYHTMGSSKSAQHGFERDLQQFRVPGEDEKAVWKQQLEKAGIQKLSIF